MTQFALRARAGLDDLKEERALCNGSVFITYLGVDQATDPWASTTIPDQRSGVSDNGTSRVFEQALLLVITSGPSAEMMCTRNTRKKERNA